MRRLRWLAALAAMATVVLAVHPAPVYASSGGCSPYIDGNVVPVPCTAVATSSASSGGEGRSVVSTCGIALLDRAQATGLGLSWPPPSGERWALLTCFAGTSRSAPQAGLVSNSTGAPEVTPRQLLAQALAALRVPYLSPSTAPPRGSQGLVGLPEWFWIPAADWHPRTVTVRAGPVWATVMASPVGLSFTPGGGLAQVSCRGPGTPYVRQLPAQGQHTACSYTYEQPSIGQPGNAFRAAVTVTWRISWTGSGGQRGVLASALPLPVSVPLAVAQGEALVVRP